MGLDAVGVNFLLSAAARGVSFEKMMMLGRQNMHAAPAEFRRALATFGRRAPDPSELERLCPPGREGFCEPFLREVLGAAEISSMDLSAFEGASHIHDLNDPIPDSWTARFTAVLDGGTLEHVFNFPQAISNAMKLVAEGGHLLSLTPANNACGHGFFQFSPDLYFRVLSPPNGFRVERLLLVEYGAATGDWYEVFDPASVGAWTAIPTPRVTYMLVQARRERIVPVLRTVPRQSVYVPLWSGTSAGRAAPPPAGPIDRLKPLAAPLLRWARRAFHHLSPPLVAPPYGRKLTLAELGPPQAGGPR